MPRGAPEYCHSAPRANKRVPTWADHRQRDCPCGQRWGALPVCMHERGRPMTNATDPNPNQVIRQGPRDYDALLHGAYIGSFPSELQAWTELNRVSFEQLH